MWVVSTIEKIKRMKSSVCLAMIVKDESDVIVRCLRSVSDVIDYWVIVDTGSSDGTPRIIEEEMKQLVIAGELHHRPWKSFDSNRNECLELARGKCEYTLVIDADDYLEISDEAVFNELTLDAYKIELNLGDNVWNRIQLFKSEYDWSYEGVLHEYLKIPNISGYTEDLLPNVKMIAATSAEEGSSKYLDDAKVFMREILYGELSEDLRRRYTYYLGQSLRDGGDFAGALLWYTQRSRLGGWPEEVYVSLWMCARMKRMLNYREEEVINSYLKAWEARPERQEALFELLQLLHAAERWHLGFVLCRSGLNAKASIDTLSVDVSISQWRMVNLWTQFAFKCGHLAEAMSACENLIASSAFASIPKEEQFRIVNNLEVFETSLINTYQ